jgi:predicted dehydrogenase
MAGIIRWGVVGSGGIARRRTIPEGLAVSDSARLAAVYDLDPEVNREVGARFQALPAKDLGELLGSGVDSVYVASPVSAHYGQVLQCLRAGKHVLCEKPLALDAEQAEELVDVAEAVGVTLGTAFMMRFQSQHREALRLIREGRLGELTYGRAQLSCWYPPIPGAWRQDPGQGGGGSLMDLGGHCIDLLEMFFGRVCKVACFTNNTVHRYASEDSAAALLYFGGGALATVDVFFCIPDAASRNSLEIYGSQGAIVAGGTIGQGSQGEMTGYFESPDTAYDEKQSRGGKEGVPIRPVPVNIYRAEIEDFSQAIIEGRQPLLLAEEGLHNQRILAACYESARSGQTILVR